MTTAETTRTVAAQNIAPMQELPVERGVMAMRDKFHAVLPPHVPSDRFVRAAISALQKPDIAAAAGTGEGRKSIYDACLKAATDGLLLDGREAALVKFDAKVKDASGREVWEPRAQYMPMVAGLMKKARNSGEIAAIVSQVVFENDTFEVDYVTDGAPITHKPLLGERGKAIGVYAIARFKDGSWSQPEVMSVQEVNLVRNRSRAKDKGPWVTDWNEMARKTVIRRASKYWPSSTDKDGVSFDDVVQRDDSMIELTASDVVEQRPAIKQRSAAKLIEQAPADDAHDDETGEVLDGADA